MLYTQNRTQEENLMNRNKFTKREIQLIKNNPYTYKVTEAQICYTREFKEEFWRRYQAGGTPRIIVEALGYDRTVSYKWLSDKYPFRLYIGVLYVFQRNIPCLLIVQTFVEFPRLDYPYESDR